MEKLLQQLERRLEQEKARRISRAVNRLSFSGGVFRLVSAWNLLVPISAGEIEVIAQSDQLLVLYYLRFTQMVIIATLIVVGCLGPPVWQAPNLTITNKVGVLGLAWFWLCGGNFVITAFRFHELIRHAYT